VNTLDVDLAAAFFKASCGMDVQRVCDVEYRLIGFGSDDFALRLQAADSLHSGALVGLSVAVLNVDEAVRTAALLGGKVMRNATNVTYVASLIPDEALDLAQPWLLRAVVLCPYTGLDIEFVQHPPRSTFPTRFIRHVSFRVSDLDTTASLYSSSMFGMQLHRKRSLVPTEPAISLFMNYALTEHEDTLLEFRYTYGNAYGRQKQKRSTLGIDEVQISISEKFQERVIQEGIEFHFVDELAYVKTVLAQTNV
jgi:catechol 2,3-dioxygenase-like lactoylglutathione lyase family enzyme/predicted enzyme related to lactoylglutathione lyase